MKNTWKILIVVLLCGSIGSINALPKYYYRFPHTQTAAGPGPLCRSILPQGSSGCCNPGTQDCFSFNQQGQICYCDESCHLAQQCCSDIAEVGCFPTTCTAMGMSLGCCKWGSGNNMGCYVEHGRCYCDRKCHQVDVADVDDCCRDVDLNTQCPSDEVDISLAESKQPMKKTLLELNRDFLKQQLDMFEKLAASEAVSQQQRPYRGQPYWRGTGLRSARKITVMNRYSK